MGAREEIDKLPRVVTGKERFLYPDLVWRRDVLSILDQWECVAEDTVREGEFLKERGELLRDVIGRMLTPVPTQWEIVEPGDTISIYARRADAIPK